MGLSCFFLAFLLFALVPGPSTAISVRSDDKTVFSLINRDSEASPIKRNLTSVTERIRAYRRAGQMRGRYFYRRIMKTNAAHPTDDSEYIDLDNGISKYSQYYLKVYVSDSYKEVWLVYDTGSDLIWFQCKGCNPCFQQPNPAFDFSASPSASIVSCSDCNDDIYQDLPTSCSSKRCSYNYGYVDGSSISGFLAKETFSFAGSNAYPDIIFGCATKSIKMDGNPDGIAGFSLGATSLPNQLSPYLGRSAFSSCLVRNDLDVENKLILGPKAVAPSGISYTPLVNPDGSSNLTPFYNIQVSKVLVGSTAVSIPSSAFNKGSGTIIDSGTTYIYLQQAAADPILKQVRRAVKKLSVVSSQDSLLCYALTINSVLDLNKYFPQITFVFKGNVNVKLLGYHYMVANSDDGTVCTVINYADSDGTNLLGSYFQQDFLVVHDLDRKRVGFKPVNCKTGKAR